MHQWLVSRLSLRAAAHPVMPEACREHKGRSSLCAHLSIHVTHPYQEACQPEWWQSPAVGSSHINHSEGVCNGVGQLHTLLMVSSRIVLWGSVGLTGRASRPGSAGGHACEPSLAATSAALPRTAKCCVSAARVAPPATPALHARICQQVASRMTGCSCSTGSPDAAWPCSAPAWPAGRAGLTCHCPGNAAQAGQEQEG